MKLCIIALDYDGTFALNGRAHPAALDAVRQARSRGVRMILVTGRILSELKRVLPEHDIFDAIVAENGAVLAFPNDKTQVLARPPSHVLFDELCRRDVAINFGECIVEADAKDAPVLLQTVRQFELPLTLLFNRSRVMLLPQGISKATGLRQLLRTLRLSLHNCIGIGDAENDHALLDACEIGAAVAWGSKGLREIADHVIEGDPETAVGEYIREVSGHPRLPPHRAHSRRILLGHTSDGAPVEAAVHGHNVLITGDPRSGKSWITGLGCEQLILHGYCLCVIDPEGDYAPLESLPGVIVMAATGTPPRMEEIERALRYPEVSVVLDLSTLHHEEKSTFVNRLLPKLAELRRRVGLPHWIVVDEAHYFLRQANLASCVDFDLAAYVLVTYRPSQLPPALMRAVESTIATPFTNREEIAALAEAWGAEGAATTLQQLLGNLAIDEAALINHLDPKLPPTRFKIANRITSHVRHRAKYIEVPLPSERAFVFTCNSRAFGPPARTLSEFVTLQDRVPSLAMESHARRGDFSRWIEDVFGDAPLAASVRRIEAGFRQGKVKNITAALGKVIRERYAIRRCPARGLRTFIEDVAPHHDWDAPKSKQT